MIHNYKSDEATSSGECSNAAALGGCPEPLVFSTPTSGAQSGFPSHVVLSSDVPDAIIHYTTDGTEPDSLSTIYTAPILIGSSGILIRAVAHTEGCPLGPSISVQYANPSFPFVFSYACDTPDNGGEWGVFVPNANNDHHWQLQFTLPGAQTIKRLEVYQLDADGNWTTGQAWSTDSPISPVELGAEFDVYPLLVFEAAVQKWAAYQSSLGSFGPGAITWDLYGDIVAEAGGLFRLKIILGDNSELSQTIDGTTCTATPPLCAPPATPTLNGQCDGLMDVTFIGTVGRPYKVYQATFFCGSGIYSEVDSGTIDVSPKTVQISGLSAGCLYAFYVSVDEAGCGFRDSSPAFSGVPPNASVTISTDKTIVDPDESFTISWTSINVYTAVCGGCLAGEVSINHSIGCKPGNTSGSVSQSQSVCGVYTYQITGCNDCGTVIASVQVEVRCAATCPEEEQPTLVGLGGSSSFLCDLVGGCGLELFYQPQWTGLLSGAPCQWLKASNSGVAGCVRHISGNIYEGYIIDVEVKFVPLSLGGPFWQLRITAQAVVGAPLVWEGRRLYGSLPFGEYTKVDGCASGPATMTVVEVFT